MSTAIYIKIASRAIRTSSTIDCHQEPFSFPSGYSESPTPASSEGVSFMERGTLMKTEIVKFYAGIFYYTRKIKFSHIKNSIYCQRSFQTGGGINLENIKRNKIVQEKETEKSNQSKFR